jgi:hypothetical protein
VFLQGMDRRAAKQIMYVIGSYHDGLTLNLSHFLRIVIVSNWIMQGKKRMP